MLEQPAARCVSRRRLLIGVSGFVGLGILAACGAPASPTPQPTAPSGPAAEPTKAADKPAEPTKAASSTTAPASTAPAKQGEKADIRLLTREGSEADTLADRLPAFSQANPNISVKHETVPSAEYFQKLQTLAAGAQLQDVVWLSESWGWHRRSAKTGTLLAVDEFVRVDTYDLKVYMKAAVESLTYEGKMWGLPFKANSGTNVIFSNVDQLTKAGLREPTMDTTFDELAQLASQATLRSGNQVDVWGFIPYIKGGGHHMTTLYTRAFGGEVLSEDGAKSLMNSDAAKAGMTWVYNLIFKHKGAPSLQDATGALVDMFTTGTGAMYQGGTFDFAIPTRIQDKFKVVSTLMPKGPTGRRGSLLALDFLSINAKSKFPDASWELMKWLCDKETGIRLGEGTGGASGTAGARIDALQDPRLSENPLRGPVLDGIIGAEAARLTHNFRDAEFWSAAASGLEPLWLGDVEPTDQFFNDLNSEMQMILDKPAT